MWAKRRKEFREAQKGPWQDTVGQGKKVDQSKKTKSLPAAGHYPNRDIVRPYYRRGAVPGTAVTITSHVWNWLSIGAAYIDTDIYYLASSATSDKVKRRANRWPMWETLVRIFRGKTINVGPPTSKTLLLSA